MQKRKKIQERKLPAAAISRRSFIEGAGAVVVAGATGVAAKAQSPNEAIAFPDVPRTAIRVTVNGVEHHLRVEDRWTIAEMLRDHLDLTGTKIGCDRGECGACTVLLNGEPVYSCSNLAVWADGRTIQTVEGLSKNGKLDPLQQAFIDHDGPQCGFCTSGQLMSAKALINRNPHPSPDDVKAALTGNICRCANYNRYIEAVMAVTASGRPASGSERTGR